MKKYSYLLLPLLLLASCEHPEPNPTPPDPDPVEVPGEGYTPEFNPLEAPSFVYGIEPYAGQTASDVPQYAPEDDELNPTLTKWKYIVEVRYDGSNATVVNPTGSTVTYDVVGANVDLNLGATDYVKVVATGWSDTGSLRISGDRRHLLQLSELTLSSPDRPAINDQNSKRLFLEVVGHNALSDGSNYAVNGFEDRKGCFFSESHVVLCGDGVLTIEGKNQHGFATDGFLYVNPGVTLVVTDAVRNAIHVKGSASQANAYRGIEVVGGYVYANTSAPRGKAMKSDSHIRIRGGEVNLNCSGNAALDPEDGSLSSAACIKSDLSVAISGGRVSLTATGDGAKGIKANASVSLGGGIVNVALSGNAMSGGGDSATPKGIKADSNLMITGGGNYVSAKGSGSVGIESGTGFDVSGGVTYAFGVAGGLRCGGTPTHKAGTLVSGGALATNKPFPGSLSHTYNNVSADKVSVLMSADGSEAIASFRWPVSLLEAQLMYLR